MPVGLDQVQEARRAAWDFFTLGAKRVSLEYLDEHKQELRAEQDVQELAIALRDPDNSAQPWGTAAEIRRLHPDEIEVLHRIVVEYQKEHSPLSAAETIADLEEKLDALGKGQGKDWLAVCDFATLASIVTGLATRLTRAMAEQPTTTSPDTSERSHSSGDSTSTSEPASSPQPGSESVEALTETTVRGILSSVLGKLAREVSNGQSTAESSAG